MIIVSKMVAMEWNVMVTVSSGGSTPNDGMKRDKDSAGVGSWWWCW